MSMSTEVVGIVVPDEKFRQMLAAWNACEEAGVSFPQEIVEFFDGRTPNPDGMEIDIPNREYHGDGESGLEVDVKDIPASVKTIRFVNSW